MGVPLAHGLAGETGFGASGDGVCEEIATANAVYNCRHDMGVSDLP